MRESLVLLFCLTFGNPLAAQISKGGIRVPYDSDITKTVPAKDRFLFENFRKGTVYFRNGSKSVAPLNYSYFHSELEFITTKNDTLLLADNNFVRRIVIDDLLFYYCPDQGHLQQIGDYDKIRLCKKQQLVPTATEHSSMYGKHFATASVSSYAVFPEIKGLVQPLKPGNYVVMRKANSYFFMDQNDRFHAASKANLLKIFPGYRDEINNYFKENTVNFYNEQDLVKLLEHCKSF